jgi:protoporphyrinogen oxidase
LFPIKEEKSLADFLINRFGKTLYQTFFKDYTEKVWGVPCEEISAEWGAQRIKGLSITKAILHALKSKRKSAGISQKTTETSLIERFMYPRLGPGQMWELVADKIKAAGGTFQFGVQVLGLEISNQKVTSVRLKLADGSEELVEADYVISSMPIKDLVNGVRPLPSEKVVEVANGLVYRDFITVGLLIKKFKRNAVLEDNWIYIQERDVKIGRLQIFNNWSPDLVENSQNIWLGLEYFCQENDDLWNLSETDFFEFAVQEMIKLDLITREDVLDGTVLKVPKTYPAYFGSYEKFDVITDYLNGIQNLFPIGRNGMHRYNNQDHSMLTGMMAAENIVNGITDKTEMWKINTEMEYHEEK